MKEYGRKLIDTSASCLVVLAPERPQRLGPAWERGRSEFIQTRGPGVDWSKTEIYTNLITNSWSVTHVQPYPSKPSGE